MKTKRGGSSPVLPNNMEEILPKDMIHGTKYYTQSRGNLSPGKSGRQLGVFDKLKDNDPNYAIFSSYRDIAKKDGTLGKSGLTQSDNVPNWFHTSENIFYKRKALENMGTRDNRYLKFLINKKTNSDIATLMPDWISHKDSPVKKYDHDKMINDMIKEKKREQKNLERRKAYHKKKEQIDQYNTDNNITKNKRCPKGEHRNKLGECVKSGGRNTRKK